MDIKKRVVARLEGRELVEMAEEHWRLGEEILEKVSLLEHNDMDCRCDDDKQEVYKYVHEGNHLDEVMAICVKCGGYVER